MNERAIFIAALDRDTPDDRAAYLAEACAGDPALRGRVEALLRSHEEAGEFPGKIAPRRLVDEFAAREADDTQTGQSGADADLPLDFLAPSDQPDSLGRLGHYEVKEVIGRGGMGVVLKGFDEQLHRVVAIKVMAQQLATSATARQRFIREARAAAAVSHDHVVTIHAVESAGPRPHIVMQFIAGASLQDRLDRSGPLPLAEILRIGMQTAAGLAAAHAQGLVHRDVKPANILLENGVERVKITDFGLARAADDASLTQSGTVAGTPAFMSPEQAEGKPVDHRSDLFSLGSVLYAMCTGRPPFRASTGMGVLKRVCEETPTPIRESNPEAPDWLTAVIGKLHAKDPAERFQSAAELAEVLGRRLAHVQHPSIVPAPAAPSPLLPPGKGVADAPARRPYRWAVAAAALVAVLAILGTTEATGVTKVRATLVRIFTPEGTLVVETDDPAVKVTVEGDGDLVITGAGPREVRLRAGSYRLRATKDGKPVRLDRDLVAISRDDRQVVRVRLANEQPAAVAPRVESGAFVLLGSTSSEAGKFDTLAEAVEHASDGDTIEVRGNGPFVTQPISIGASRLTIRAATGCRPVIKGTLGQRAEKWSYLLSSEGPLVLEGLVLHMTGSIGSQIVNSVHGPLHVANCRFELHGACSITHASPVTWVRNCEFVSGSSCYAIHIQSHPSNNGITTLENNLFASPLGHALGFVWLHPDLDEAVIHLKHNTVATRNYAIVHGVVFVPESAKAGPAPRRPPVQLHASANLFDVRGHDPEGVLSMLESPDMHRPEAPPLSAKEAEALLPRLMAWREEQNVYCNDLTFQLLRRAKDPAVPRREPILEELPAYRTLAGWQRMWKTGDSGSSQGTIRYVQGNVFAKMQATPERVTAEDFRLRPDSPGYRAGPEGKDLGIDVDFVGPGPAYERWKKTTAYQQWRVETGQVKN